MCECVPAFGPECVRDGEGGGGGCGDYLFCILRNGGAGDGGGVATVVD